MSWLTCTMNSRIITSSGSVRTKASDWIAPDSLLCSDRSRPTFHDPPLSRATATNAPQSAARAATHGRTAERISRYTPPPFAGGLSHDRLPHLPQLIASHQYERQPRGRGEEEGAIERGTLVGRERHPAPQPHHPPQLHADLP